MIAFSSYLEFFALPAVMGVVAIYLLVPVFNVQTLQVKDPSLEACAINSFLRPYAFYFHPITGVIFTIFSHLS